MGAGLDAFGRLRTSSPQTIFDSKYLVDANPLYWDDVQTAGAGTTSVFSVNQASVTLAVSAATAGTRVRQTFRRFSYQPGKSQFVSFTRILGTPAAGITRRSGLFDEKNGIFFQSGPTGMALVLRSFTSGVAVDTVIPQASWNRDKLDGTGPSGVTLDPSKIQIFVIDFQWLGSGTIRFCFNIAGSIIIAHEADFANTSTTVYISTPNNPLRDEIVNDGTGGVATLVAICSTVISEGGQQFTGANRGIARTTALVTLNNANLYPLVAIRLGAGKFGTEIKIRDLSVICPSAADFIWYLILNPTVVGTALAFAAIANSAVEADITSTNATTVTGGTILRTDTASQSASGPGVIAPDPTDVQLGATIAGVADVLVLATQRITGAAETFYGTLQWRETQ